MRAHNLSVANAISRAEEKMRLLAVALVALLAASVSCQELDCAFPTNSDIESIMGSALRSADSPVEPTITLIGDFHTVCLAFSEQKDRYRAISVLVQYTCDGSSNCPSGTVTEQFETQCNDNNEWTNQVLGDTANTRTMSPSATTSTQRREDCSFCASPAKATGVGITTDAVTHCVSESVNLLCTLEISFFSQHAIVYVMVIQ